MKSELQSSIYEFGGFRIDTVRRLLLRGDDEVIPLTPKIFDTLLYLVQNNGKLIEKDQLMSEIWADTIVEENNLNKNISVLRGVLGEKPGEHRFIVTVPGRGYKFVAEVASVSPQSEVPILNSLEISDAGSQDPDAIDEIQKPKAKNQYRKNLAFGTLILLIAVGAALYFWRSSTTPFSARIKPLPFCRSNLLAPKIATRHWKWEWPTR